VADLVNGGKHAYLFNSVDEGVADIAQKSKSGDVVAVLSNGGFGGFIPKLLDLLAKR
jgi:UDP-N-acetylmuramate-alanine ligase